MLSKIHPISLISLKTQFSGVLEIQGEAFSYYGTILAYITSIDFIRDMNTEYQTNIKPEKIIWMDQWLVMRLSENAFLDCQIVFDYKLRG